jgi:hypothetical protein
MTPDRQTEAVTKLLSAIDELNVAKPLIGQAAWVQVCLWVSVLRPVNTTPSA